MNEEKNLKILKIIENNTIPAKTFPYLLKRHSDQLKSSNVNEKLKIIQQHEIYMYLFYSEFKPEHSFEIKVANSMGIILSNINVENINLDDNVDEKYFYNFLLEAPLPFIFIPKDVHSNLKLCEGAKKFTSGESHGVLIDLNFAEQIGLGFMASNFIKKEGVHMLFIGFIV